MMEEYAAKNATDLLQAVSFRDLMQFVLEVAEKLSISLSVKIQFVVW